MSARVRSTYVWPSHPSRIGEALERVCWSEQKMLNLHQPTTVRYGEEDQCSLRFETLELAKHACEAARKDWCGGITKDAGIRCGGQLRPFELRTSDILPGRVPAWLLLSKTPDTSSARCKMLPEARPNRTERERMMVPKEQRLPPQECGFYETECEQW